MEIGNEISQKIRSAIKAKLVELGAYVDDELPDYIMVMVANKKSKAHMTDDLNLFLGNNTEKFTAWLHGLLQKLKSITVEQNKAGATNREDNGTTNLTVETTAESNTVCEIEEKQEEPKLTERQRKKLEEEEEVERALEAIEEDELTLQPETDEFAEEEKMVSASKQKKPPERSSSSDTRTKPRTIASQAKHAVVQALAESSRSRTGSKSSTKAATLKIAASSPKESNTKVTKTSTRRTTSPSSSSKTESRKRKAPGSVIGSVIHREDDEEDDENSNYDPHKPQYGRVASTVKVGQRRPSVPPAKQASKSLLMKAVSEAKTSVEKTTKKSSKAVVQPTRRSHTSETRASVHSRLGDSTSDARDRLGERHISSSSRRKSSPERPTSRSKMRSDHIAAKKSAVSHTGKETLTDTYETGIRIKKTIKVDNESEDDDKSTSSSLGKETDSRVFESKSEVGSEDEEDSRTVTKRVEDEGPQLDLLIQSGAEDSDFTDEENQGETETADIKKRHVQEPIIDGREKTGSPKFVVSLDGIDPEIIEKFEGRIDEDLEEEEQMVEMDAGEELPAPQHRVREESTVRPRNIVRVRPMQVLGNQADVETKRQKMERCNFWPACRSGNDCPYFHPTTPCKAFPNCSFGEKCNYIHPNCMFDASCTRANCPYTHINKKRAPASSPPIIIQPIKMVPMASPAIFNPRPPAPPTRPQGKTACKFFPKCTNMDCPFYHPKPCRFGLSCRNRLSGCTFTHPSLPTKDKLKWTASERNPSTGHDDSLDTVVIEQTDVANPSDEEEESVNVSL